MPDIRKREIKTILLSGYTGLGHFILKSVLVQKLQELFPESKISIIARKFLWDRICVKWLSHIYF